MSTLSYARLLAQTDASYDLLCCSVWFDSCTKHNLCLCCIALIHSET